MKKLNTWTAVLILISILLYTTLALGKQEKGFRNRHSGSDRNPGLLNSNLNDKSYLSFGISNITNKAVFYITQRLN